MVAPLHSIYLLVFVEQSIATIYLFPQPEAFMGQIERKRLLYEIA